MSAVIINMPLVMFWGQVLLVIVGPLDKILLMIVSVWMGIMRTLGLIIAFPVLINLGNVLIKIPGPNVEV